MASTLQIDHKEMHDIRSAASASGYSRDHVASLARAQKIVATQVGRQWYVDLDSLVSYTEITKLEQKVKQKHLSEERRSSSEITERLEASRLARKQAYENRTKKVTSTVASLLVLSTLIGGSLTYFAPEVFSSLNEQLASAPNAADFNPVIVTDGQSRRALNGETITTFSDGGVIVATLATPEEAIVLLPEGLATSTEVFSDEVTVVYDATGNRRLVLKKDSESEGIPFVEVKVSEILIP